MSRAQYTMDTDWLSYYFSPLVSMWFCIIWLTMWLFHSQNHIGIFVLVKIFLSALLVGLFFFFQVPLRLLFELTNSVFLTEWNAREWTFRVTLDFLVAYVGMVVALIAIKLSELRLAESHHWSNYAQMGVYVAVAGSVGYVFFENSLDKFTYNIYHPYASIVPVVAFAILRNATPFLRSVNSRFFMYFGQCSLETFIIQVRLLLFQKYREWLLTWIDSSICGLPQTPKACWSLSAAPRKPHASSTLSSLLSSLSM